MTNDQRFWAYVSFNSPCWEWQAKRDKDGYGRFWVNGKTVGAHRYAYEFYHNLKLNSKILVCHSCDNPSCVNPNHLFSGSHQDNKNDSVKKNRHSKNNSGLYLRAQYIKINKVQARSIFDRKMAGESPTLLAKEFGLNRTTIYRIFDKEWRDHVEVS